MKAQISILFTLALASLATAGPFPQETATPAAYGTSSTTTKKSTKSTKTKTSTTKSSSTSSSLITTAPGLTCTSGSTVLYTTECTQGTPTSYCYSPPPPISCGTGFFPGTYHPGHCETASTCYPTDAPWITTSCSNGETAYSTSTLYQGTLAGGKSTVISVVDCACATNEWYSYYSYTTTVSGSPQQTGANFCMPHTSCPTGMTTSTSTNEYCATAPPESCSGVPLTTDFCVCGVQSTAVYPKGGATATGCKAVKSA